MTTDQYERLITTVLDLLRQAVEYDQDLEARAKWSGTDYFVMLGYLTQVKNLLENRHATHT